MNNANITKTDLFIFQQSKRRKTQKFHMLIQDNPQVMFSIENFHLAHLIKTINTMNDNMEVIALDLSQCTLNDFQEKHFTYHKHLVSITMKILKHFLRNFPYLKLR